MTKQDAISHMISEIENIEKERLRVNFSIDPTTQKKEVVDAILKALKGVEIDNEDQQD